MFARELVVAEAGAVREAENEVFFSRREVEEPSVGGVDVFGFDEAVFGHYFGRESVSGF